MSNNLMEDWLNSIKPAKEVTVDKVKDDKKDTTEFANEMPGGIYQITFEYNTSADAVVEKNAQQLESFTRTWRLVSNFPEVGEAVDEIINEMIIADTQDTIVKIDLGNIKDEELSKEIKDTVADEFEIVIDLLDFQKNAQDLAETWYIDGRLDYEVVVKKANTKLGIQKLNRLDPLNIKKIFDKKTKEQYWIYTDPQTLKKWKVSPDLVVHTGSGRTDRVTGLEVSYLHKALKAINNLRLIEDAIVIYRIIRAPEKRVFSIDTGNLPKPKAEEYIKGLIAKFQNKVVYDTVTGSLTNQKNVMAMIEDFYLAKSASGQGSSISTLAAGTNLGELDDLYYFVLKVYKALKVPESRRETKEKSMYDFGSQATQIERDEIKFMKFINGKLRKQFSTLFTELLYRQLLFKGILSKEAADKVKKKIRYIWTNDNYYDEIKESEMMKMRMGLVQATEMYVGRFFTDDDIALKILKYTDEEWKKKKKECEKIKKEKDEEEAKRAQNLQPDSDLNINGVGGDLGGAGGGGSMNPPGNQNFRNKLGKNKFGG